MFYLATIILSILNFLLLIFVLLKRIELSSTILIALISLSLLCLISAVISFILKRREVSMFEKNYNEIRAMIQNLSGVTDQVSNSSENLNQGTIEQGEALEETASAAEEISATARRNLNFTDESKKKIDNCLDSVKNGESSMNSLMSSFNGILEGNKEFSEFIKDNNEQLNEIKNVISEISEKTSVINDIVFQTKLLAFNASVEAARAGEHGKGFAVVAEEVGSLASMSGKASHEISGILDKGLVRVEEIITNTQTTVSKIVDKADQRIDEGEKLANINLENFKSLRNEVTFVHQNVSEIAIASTEQSQGIEEVNKAIRMLEQNNQRTGLVAKQSYEISNSLKDDFLKLNELFKKSLIKSDIEYSEFEWDDKYLIGVKEMDDEHQILIKKINTFVRSLNGKGDPIQTYEDLKKYTVKHFQDEENFMRSIDYSSFEAHKKIHGALIEKVLNFEKELKDGTIDKTRVVAFLKNWLVSHILGVDTQYAKEANSQKS